MSYASIKRLSDFVLAGLLLILFAPLFGAIALLILLIDGRPIFFSQVRPGKGGRLFKLLKFRTMRVVPYSDAGNEDPGVRVTNLGRLLRRLSLDELPQLANILLGQMAFVGPRPLLPEYLSLYSSRQSMRHMVLPGLSGLAQVSGRNELSWEDRLELDVSYVENLGPRLDFEILVRSLLVAISGRGVYDLGGKMASPFRGAEVVQKPED